MRRNSTTCASCWKGASELTMIAAFNLNAIAQTSSLQIVDCLVEGTLIAVFAGLMSRMARRQNSGTRFARWFAALMAIAVVPFLGHALWPQAGGISASTLSPPPITLPVFWALYLFAAWAAIAGWSLLGVGRSLWHLHVLRNSCAPVDTTVLDARLQETLEHRRSTRAAVLRTSAMVQVPTAIGLVRPAVVIPEWVMRELSPDELNQILLHELAHLRRYDDWTNLAQKIVKAIFFFHPAVWFIESRLTLEREMACDDAVLAASFSPRAYAESLVSLAEKSFLHRGVQLAQAAVSHVQQLKLRLAEILRKDRPSDAQRSTHKPAIALMSLAAIVTVYGFSHAPRLIGFSSDSPQTASADSHSLSSAKASRLQPVNLNYTDRSHPVSAPACKVTVQRAHRHLPDRVETTTPVLMANHPADTRMSVEMASSRMVLSKIGR